MPIDELEQNKKQARRETTLKAKDILSPLICKRKEITDEEILNILPILNEDAVSNNMWDAERVKKYLLRHDSNKKTGKYINSFVFRAIKIFFIIYIKLFF